MLLFFRGFRLFVVRENSMHPRLQDGDVLLCKRKLRYERGECVILDDPMAQGEWLVKRVIGLPGEYVTMDSGDVSVDETRLHEPYLEPVAGDARHDAGAWLLDENEYFALGDSRAISIDSRRFGPVNGHAIVGACLWRVWPLRRWGRLPRQ